MMSNTGIGKIKSLQTVRCLAFFIVFLAHANIISEELGGAGVSVFFVLSGFIFQYAYWDRMNITSIKNACLFSLNKIKKLYPLHIIMMICAALVMKPVLINMIHKELGNVILQFSSNIFLFKALIPSEQIYFSLNGVSWFLSACLILYFFFPFIYRRVRNLSKKNAIARISIAYIIYVIIMFTVKKLGVALGWSDGFMAGLIYISPLYRLFDFYIGINLCIVFKNKKENNNNKYYSLYEIILFIFAIAMLYSYVHILPRFGKIWNDTTAILFLPISVVFIYLFAVNKGLISRVLTNRLTIFIGNLTAITFLTHTVVMKYITAMCDHFHIALNSIVYAIISFLIVLAVSFLYKKMKEYLKKQEILNHLKDNRRRKK